MGSQNSIGASLDPHSLTTWLPRKQTYQRYPGLLRLHLHFLKLSLAVDWPSPAEGLGLAWAWVQSTLCSKATGDADLTSQREGVQAPPSASVELWGAANALGIRRNLTGMLWRRSGTQESQVKDSWKSNDLFCTRFHCLCLTRLFRLRWSARWTHCCHQRFLNQIQNRCNRR